jgi:hypothetical protein
MQQGMWKALTIRLLEESFASLFDACLGLRHFADLRGTMSLVFVYCTPH